MQASPPVLVARPLRLPLPGSLGVIVLRAVVFCAVAGILAALWTPLAPTRLFDFDAANFALSLNSFQPTVHQPQPPGYPLYVGLAKVIHVFVEDVTLVFLIAGLIGAAAAILMLWLLSERLFGREAAIFAALLLMTNPILWQTGMSDQVRVYIAVVSIGVALAVWPVWERTPDARPPNPARFAVACLVLGATAGFRPEMLVSMAPLLAITALRRRMKLWQYAASAAALCAGMAPWLIVLLSRVGGIDGFVKMMRTYSADQAGRSSILFGADWAGAGKMFAAGFWWASLGTVSWILAILLVKRRRVSADRRGAWWFLLAWFVPLFLFSIVVHIAASGHSLGFIPILCLAGGWTLAAVGRSYGRGVMLVCAAGALSLNVYFFFRPYAREVREAGFHTIAGIDSINEATLDRIDIIRQRTPTSLVTDNNAWVSWRILEYYYPDSAILYLPGPWATVAKSPPAWLFRNWALGQDLDPASELSIPSCGTIVWLVSDARSKRDLLSVHDAEDERYFITTPARPGQQFRIGRYRLATSRQACSSAH